MTRKILIIDDDEAFCRTLCRTLERKGYEAFHALDSEQALHHANVRKPDLAVLDLRLGEESGLQLIKPLLGCVGRMRIVVLTGYASLTTAVKAVKLGALDYLAKPVDADTILCALNEKKIERQDDSSEWSPTPLKLLEWEHLQRVLAENNGNISATARQLGMHRRTLQRKLQKKPDLGRGNP